MAKLATLVAAFAVLMVAASATRSMVMTTVDVDDLNQQWGGGQGRCRQQLQMTGGLNHCRMFLMDQARCSEGGSGSRWGSRGSSQWGSRCQYGQCDDDNQFGIRGTGAACPSMHFEQCCDQLSQLDQQCRCEGLREVMMRQQQQQRGGQFSHGQQTVEEVASNLPQMCGIGPQFCQVSRRYLDN